MEILFRKTNAITYTREPELRPGMLKTEDKEHKDHWTVDLKVRGVRKQVDNG